jgi:hypothetical protein
MRKILILSILALFVVFGCSGDKSTAPDTTGTQPQEFPEKATDIFDSYQPTDDDLYNAMVADPNSPPQLDGYDVFAVTLLWGDIFHTTAQMPLDTTDWSGLVIGPVEAIINPHFTIAFEQGQDSIVPSYDRNIAMWDAAVFNDFDGISFLVYQKSGPSVSAYTGIVVQTELFTKQYSYEDLLELSEFHQIDEFNGIVVHSKILWKNACRGGFIKAEWIKADATDVNQGEFHGFWLDGKGQRIGHLDGKFWQDENHHGLFEGSVSGLDTDEVIAKVSGQWFYDDYRLCPMCGADHGQFHGKFEYLDGSISGHVRGVIGDYHLDVARQSLPMVGIWRENCPYGPRWSFDQDRK